MGVGSRKAGPSISEPTDLFCFVYSRESALKKRKYPVCSSYLSENAMLMPEIRGKGMCAEGHLWMHTPSHL